MLYTKRNDNKYRNTRARITRLYICVLIISRENKNKTIITMNNYRDQSCRTRVGL